MFPSGDTRLSGKTGPLQSVENKLDLSERAIMNGLNNTNTGGCGFATKIRTDTFTDSYIIEGQIGRGKFAAVKRVKNKHSGAEYAAKFLRKRRKGVDCRHEVLHEISMLEMARVHNRLVDLVEVFETKNEFILITEYASGGELHTYVCQEEDGLDERSVIRLMKQILEGLIFLHDRNIVHLDVKPQNILLTQSFPQGEVKLCDFGFARTINSQDDVRDIIGTPDYVAPEILDYEPIQTACDMWSVGVLAYVLLTGCSPFAGDTKQETLFNISQVNLEFPDDLFEGISSKSQDFITKLLVRDQRERMTARDCMNHAWLKEDMATPAKSPFGSPGGCRRALTPPSSDGSSDLEPSKKCRCDESDDENELATKDSSTVLPNNANERVQCEKETSKSSEEDDGKSGNRGSVIICNGNMCAKDSLIEGNDSSLISRDNLSSCEDSVCLKENCCRHPLHQIEQQLIAY